MPVKYEGIKIIFGIYTRCQQIDCMLSTDRLLGLKMYIFLTLKFILLQNTIYLLTTSVTNLAFFYVWLKDLYPEA